MDGQPHKQPHLRPKSTTYSSPSVRTTHRPLTHQLTIRVPIRWHTNHRIQRRSDHPTRPLHPLPPQPHPDHTPLPPPHRPTPSHHLHRRNNRLTQKPPPPLETNLLMAPLRSSQRQTRHGTYPLLLYRQTLDRPRTRTNNLR